MQHEPRPVTIRKSENRMERTPQFICRETGAAELEISPATWDRWVEDGRLPPPAPGFPESTPRWRWLDVEQRMSGKPVESQDPYVVAVTRLPHGEKKDRRRDVA